MISFTEYVERRVEKKSEGEEGRLRRGKDMKEGRGNMRKLFMVCTSLSRCMHVPPRALSTGISHAKCGYFQQQSSNSIHANIIASPVGHTLLKKGNLSY